MDETLATKVATLLDEALPDAVVLEQIVNELRRRTGLDGSATVVVGDAAVVVPMGATLTIVDKALFKETYESRVSYRLSRRRCSWRSGEGLTEATSSRILLRTAVLRSRVQVYTDRVSLHDLQILG